MNYFISCVCVCVCWVQLCFCFISVSWMTFCCKTTCSGQETMAHTEIKIAFIQTNMPTLELTKWMSKQYYPVLMKLLPYTCKRDRFRNNKEEVIKQDKKTRTNLNELSRWRCEFRVSYCNRIVACWIPDSIVVVRILDMLSAFLNLYNRFWVDAQHVKWTFNVISEAQWFNSKFTYCVWLSYNLLLLE